MDTDNNAGAPGGEEKTTTPNILEMEWDFDGPEDEGDENAAAAEPDADEELEPETEDTAPEPEPEPEETPSERKLRLRDGTEVSEGDLKKAYGEREETRREKAELESAKAQFQQQIAQIRQQEQFFAQQMPQVLATLQRNIPPAPDPSLEQTDPIAFLQLERARERAIGELRQAQNAAQFQQQQQTEAQREALARYTEAEHEQLLKKMPELKDPETRQKFSRKLMDAADAYGFGEEFQHTRDHRVIVALSDAMKWRELQSQKPKAVEKAKEAPPIVQPARRRSSQDIQAERTREQLSSLRKTGSADDAAAFLSKFE